MKWYNSFTMSLVTSTLGCLLVAFEGNNNCGVLFPSQSSAKLTLRSTKCWHRLSIPLLLIPRHFYTKCSSVNPVTFSSLNFPHCPLNCQDMTFHTVNLFRQLYCVFNGAMQMVKSMLILKGKSIRTGPNGVPKRRSFDWNGWAFDELSIVLGILSVSTMNLVASLTRAVMRVLARRAVAKRGMISTRD